MKICYVAADVAIPHYRGASTHVYEVAKHFTLLGHDVQVVARRTNSSEARDAELGKIKIRRLHRGIVFSSKKSSFASADSKGSYRGNTSRVVWKLYEIYLRTVFAVYAGLVSANLVRSGKMDVILERETSFGAGAIASILTGKPLFLEVIGNRVTRLQVWRAKKIIAYSKAMFEGTPAEAKVVLVTAGVDTELFKPDQKKREEIRNKYELDGRSVIGFVGTFQEWHGISEIIEASSTVLKTNPSTAFLMVGPYFNETQKKVTALGTSSSFVFPGPVPYESVPAFLCASDVLLAPYNPDKIESQEQSRKKQPLGSPLKLFEYMATGKPVITTAVEPMTGIIEDHKTGLLIPAGDSKALASSIQELLSDKDLSEKLGRNGMQLVLEKYSWLGVCDKMASVMKTAIGT